MNLIEGQAMTKQSKDKEAAWDVMKWIAGEKGQQRIAEGGRMCNVPEAIRTFWLPSVRQKYNVANAEAFLKAIDGATINLVAEVTENVINRDAGLAQALTDVRDGKITPKDALDTVQPKIQLVLDNYWASQSTGR
jgi:ABC-type glycerol-3-phosphate transport system substrate-binding protein